MPATELEGTLFVPGTRLGDIPGDTIIPNGIVLVYPFGRVTAYMQTRQGLVTIGGPGSSTYTAGMFTSSRETARVRDYTSNLVVGELKVNPPDEQAADTPRWYHIHDVCPPGLYLRKVGDELATAYRVRDRRPGESPFVTERPMYGPIPDYPGPPEPQPANDNDVMFYTNTR